MADRCRLWTFMQVECFFLNGNWHYQGISRWCHTLFHLYWIVSIVYNHIDFFKVQMSQKSHKKRIHPLGIFLRCGCRNAIALLSSFCSSVSGTFCRGQQFLEIIPSFVVDFYHGIPLFFILHKGSFGNALEDSTILHLQEYGLRCRITGYVTTNEIGQRDSPQLRITVDGTCTSW